MAITTVSLNTATLNQIVADIQSLQVRLQLVAGTITIGDKTLSIAATDLTTINSEISTFLADLKSKVDALVFP